MRNVKGIAAVVLVLARLALPPARAGVRVGVGLNFGFPGFYYPYYGSPYYYYPSYPVYVSPPAVVVQPAPVYQAAPVVVRPAYSSPAEAAPATLTPPQPAAAPAQPAAWNPDGADAPIQRLNSPDDGVRADAAVQLGRMKATRAVPSLVNLLSSDHSAAVREAAARGLGLIASPDSLPALQRAAQADDDREVRHSAQFAAEVIRSGLPR